MANLLLKAYGAYVQELRDALDLECSRKDAKAYGTLKEWKSVDGKIRRAERNFAKNRKSNDRAAKTKEDFGDTVKVLFVPFLLLLLKIAFDLATIVLAVYAVSRLCGKPFSFLIVIAVWLAVKILLFFLRRKGRS